MVLVFPWVIQHFLSGRVPSPPTGCLTPGGSVRGSEVSVSAHRKLYPRCDCGLALGSLNVLETVPACSA